MTASARSRPPATPRTLRAWRRIGLALGIPAAALVVVGAGARPALGRDSPWQLGLAAGVLLGLLAVVFLRRVWAEAGPPASTPARWGPPLSTAFLALWGLGVVSTWVDSWVAVPTWARSLVAVCMAGALLGTVVAALADRPDQARG